MRIPSCGRYLWVFAVVVAFASGSERSAAQSRDSMAVSAAVETDRSEASRSSESSGFASEARTANSDPGYPTVAAEGALNYRSSPGNAFRFGYQAYKRGDTQNAIEALAFAADSGHPAALWKLGRMYQTGDSVGKDDKKAFNLFFRIANEQADTNRNSPNARYAASAFVAIGEYFNDGFEGLSPDQAQARRFFGHAASYYGDAEAQFRIAVMYLLGQGGDKDIMQAARWFKLAAQKGHTGAQAEFGRLLFEGEGGFARNAVKGLMWLSIANSSDAADSHVRALHDQALDLADTSDLRRATDLAREWQAAHK